MSSPKVISVLLLDGTPVGPIKATMANWTGLVLTVPRGYVQKLDSRDDIHHSGIYFLVGDSESHAGCIYVGQASERATKKGLVGRLAEHCKHPLKDYWHTAICLTTKDNNFGATKLCYLEQKFCQLARDAGRYEVMNAVTPAGSVVSEEDRCELDEFVEKAELIVGMLGYRVFEPLLEDTGKDNVDVVYLTERQTQAKGRLLPGGGFVVLKGSVLSPLKATNSLRETTKAKRKGKEGSVLTEDMLFKTPSGAADYLTGRSTNGWDAWKTVDGRTLDEAYRIVPTSEEQ